MGCVGLGSWVADVPYCAVQVNGKVFYIDADNCEDKDLLKLISPVDPDAVPQEAPPSSPE